MNGDVFVINEVAELVDLPGVFERLNGEEVTIAGGLELRLTVDIRGTRGEDFAYLVNFRNLLVAVQARNLKKRKNPPDTDSVERNAKVSWNDCAWKPQPAEVA